MSKQWHVFYRTMGMANRNQKGWARADFLADTPEEALDQLMRQKHSVMHARVYPGADAWIAHVNWSPSIQVRHEPHEIEGLESD